MRRVAAARTVLEACAAANIPAMPVKGIVTAALLYDDPSVRPMYDVDLRVLPKDHGRIAALAREKAWPLVQSSRIYKTYTVQIDDIEVDLEGFVGPRFVCRFPVEDLFARASCSDVLGFRALVPDFTDHVVLLVVNVFKDKLELARRWAIRDLTLAPRHPEFDVEKIVRRLGDARVPTIAWLVANWLVEQEGARAWEPVRRAFEHTHDPAYVRLFRATSRVPGGLAARIVARAGAERNIDRVRAVLTAACWELEQRLSSYRYRDS